MNQVRKSVEYLKKVTLLLEATSSGQGSHPVKETFQFIYGIGVNGLSPFEIALAGKKEGDELVFHLRREEMDGFFQPLFRSFLSIPEEVQAFTLEVRIAKVSEAEERELVKAMAEATACGSGCCSH